MNAIKTLMAVSALSVVGAANATVWSLEMNTSIYFPAVNGNLNMSGFYGTFDDVTNTGSWTGTTTIPSFNTTMHYTQTFTMDETTGLGRLNLATNCTANTISACEGFTPALQGVLKNTAVNPPNINDYKNNLPFSPTAGWSGQWTLQIFKAEVDANDEISIIYIPVPMSVCVRDLIDCNVVPIPSAAWLFGSGLMGIVAASRRRLLS